MLSVDTLICQVYLKIGLNLKEKAFFYKLLLSDIPGYKGLVILTERAALFFLAYQDISGKICR